MNIRKNDIVELDITAITHEGYGIGRYNDVVVFTAFGAVGDRIKAKILKTEKRYAWAKIEEILIPSADRIAFRETERQDVVTEQGQEFLYEDCSIFYRCGGCVFRHINYEAEIEFKKQRVIDAFRKFTYNEDKEKADRLELLLDEVIGAEDINRYRNKAIFPVGRNKTTGKAEIGFYAPRSHTIMDLKYCPVQSTKANQILGIFRDYLDRLSIYDEETHKGILRNLYIRTGEGTGQVMVVAVVNLAAEVIRKNADKQAKKFIDQMRELCRVLSEQVEGLTGFVLNSNTKKTNVVLGEESVCLWGKEHIEDVLCGIRLKISPLSFYQVNYRQTERLYAKAAEYAAPSKEDTILDLYCGIGTIGLTMANQIGKLIGVEVIPQAVENAKENAELNGIDNAEFICGTAEDAAEEIQRRGEPVRTVVVDPPRKGCDRRLIDTIRQMEPERVVYVSCNAETLARDVKLLEEYGYRMQKFSVVDLFARTGHVECVILITRL